MSKHYTDSQLFCFNRIIRICSIQYDLIVHCIGKAGKNSVGVFAVSYCWYHSIDSIKIVYTQTIVLESECKSHIALNYYPARNMRCQNTDYVKKTNNALFICRCCLYKPVNKGSRIMLTTPMLVLMLYPLHSKIQFHSLLLLLKAVIQLQHLFDHL